MCSGPASSLEGDLPLSCAGSGSCGEGSSARAADVVFTLSELDLLAMVQGQLKPLAAYACGRLGVEGDLNVAMRLEKLIKTIREGPQAAEEYSV